MIAAWQYRPLLRRLHIVMVEPVEFGAGATYCTLQPDFLRLNTIVSQVTAYPDDTVVSPLPGIRGPTLYEWYQGSSHGMAAGAYPSRRDTGRYLVSVFKDLVNGAPSGVTIERRGSAVVDMRRTREDEWSVHLADGHELRCDAAVLAIGGAASAENDSAILANEFGLPPSSADDWLIARPYPIKQSSSRLKPRETVGILGLGLTGLDLIRACTVGRGGKFVREGGRLRYLSYGDEPHMVAWSRTGLPLMARAMNQKPPDTKVQPRFLTEETIDGIRRQRQRASGTRKLDFIQDLLPLLVREMAVAHDAARASRVERADQTKGCSREHAGDRPCPFDWKEFRWEQLVSPLKNKACRTADAFKSFFLDYLRCDIAEALQGNLSSPVKAACDVIRDLRDNVRYAVEFGGLTPDSHRFFDAEFLPLHNRLAVGPPVVASEELLALVEAGIVDPFCGPAPRLQWDSGSGRINLIPTAFLGTTRKLSVVVNARLSPTDVTTTSSPLIRKLLASGDIVPYVNELNGAVYRPGGIGVTDSYRVIDKQACAHANLFAIGAITEGCTWYSQVLARPYVNSRSMRDAASVAMSLWDYFAGRATPRTDSPNANGGKTHALRQALPSESGSVQEIQPRKRSITSVP